MKRLIVVIVVLVVAIGIYYFIQSRNLSRDEAARVPLLNLSRQDVSAKLTYSKWCEKPSSEGVSLEYSTLSFNDEGVFIKTRVTDYSSPQNDTRTWTPEQESTGGWLVILDGSERVSVSFYDDGSFTFKGQDFVPCSS